MSKIKNRPGMLIFYDEWRPIIENLTSEEIAFFFTSALNYSEYGFEPKFTDRALAIAWDQVKHSLIRQNISYQEKIIRSKYGADKKHWNDKSKGEEFPFDLKEWWIKSDLFSPDLFTKEPWYEEALVEHANISSNCNNNTNETIVKNITSTIDRDESKCIREEVCRRDNFSGYFSDKTETISKADDLITSIVKKKK